MYVVSILCLKYYLRCPKSSNKWSTFEREPKLFYTFVGEVFKLHFICNLTVTIVKFPHFSPKSVWFYPFTRWRNRYGDTNCYSHDYDLLHALQLIWILRVFCLFCCVVVNILRFLVLWYQLDAMSRNIVKYLLWYHIEK